MTGALPVIELVIFDLDGVLADSSPAHARAYADLWTRLGIAGPRYETIAGRRTEDVVAEETASLPGTRQEREEWARFKQSRAREYLEREPNVFPDALPALRALSARGLALAVGTGSSRPTALGMLERGGLLRYFGAVVTGDDVTVGKPDPAVFARAITASHSVPERSVVVEDSAAGLDAADRAGAWSVTVRSGIVGPGARWLGADPDLAAVVQRVVGCR